MKLRPLVAVLAAAALALPALAQPPAATAIHTPPAASPYHTTLQDADGQPISREAFDAGLRHGQRYVSKADAQTRQIVLTLLPPGIATPDSFGPTDMRNLSFTMIMVGDRHYSVEFHAIDGRRIDQRAFAAGAAQGQRYLQVLDGNSGAAILTLLPIGANSPGSLSTSRWASAPATG